MGESKNSEEDDEDNDTPISHKLKMNENSFSPWFVFDVSLFSQYRCA